MNPAILIILLFLITLLALLARRIAVPYPTVMVVGGLIICFVPQLSAVAIDPKFIFTIFLPPLLYGAAWMTSWKDFAAYVRPISYLAVALTLLTTFVVACVTMWLVPDMTWPAAFALGAIISPPDAIAISALTKRIHMPREMLLVLEGESLVNDATALVALRFAIAAAATGSFSFSAALGSFVLVSAGGVVIGLLIGALACLVHKRLDDSLIETMITFLTPYTAYVLAEQVHTSGVLAVVTAGLFVSWQSHSLFSPRLRMQATAVWDFVIFILNALVFILIGLQLPQILKNIPQYGNGMLIGLIAALVGTIIGVRMFCVIVGAYLPPALRWRSANQIRRAREVVLIGWTGMRGVVSLAAAMALDVATDTQREFPHRNLIIFVTFGVILVTLVGQSLTLPAVIRLLRIRDADEDARAECAARLAAARAGLAYISDIHSATDAFGDIGPRLIADYTRRITELEQGFGLLPAARVGIDIDPFEVHKAVLNEERRILLELRSNRTISYEIFQRLMAEVDADELRAEKQSTRKANGH